MIRRQRSVFPLMLLLLFEVAAIIGLNTLTKDPSMQIPWSRLGDWFATATLDDIVAPVLLHVALIMAYWMLISTVLTVVAMVSRIPAAIRATSTFTLPSVRRVVDGAVAASVLATSLSGLVGASAAFAADDPSSTTTAPTATTGTASSAPGDNFLATPTLQPKSGSDASSTPTTSTTTAPDETDPTSGDVDTPPDSPEVSAGEHKVVRGENLWTISRDHVANTSGKSASQLTEAEIREYWVKVVNANKNSLRSGDPHWIYPGEVITLPAR